MTSGIPDVTPNNVWKLGVLEGLRPIEPHVGDPVLGSPVHGEDDRQRAGLGQPAVRHAGVAIPEPAQIALDTQAGILEQVFVDRAFPRDRDQLVQARVRDRVSLEEDLHREAVLNVEHHRHGPSIRARRDLVAELGLVVSACLHVRLVLGEPGLDLDRVVDGPFSETEPRQHAGSAGVGHPPHVDPADLRRRPLIDVEHDPSARRVGIGRDTRGKPARLPIQLLEHRGWRR